jgi:subtilisin family serine protease
MDRAHCQAPTGLRRRFDARGVAALAVVFGTFFSVLVSTLVMNPDPAEASGTTVDLVVTRHTSAGSLGVEVVTVDTARAVTVAADLRDDLGVLAVAPSVDYWSLSLGAPVSEPTSEPARPGGSGVSSAAADADGAGGSGAGGSGGGGVGGAVDPRRAEQWNLDQVRAEPAWATVDPSGLVIAVIDTGLRADHEDFHGASVLPGVDALAFVDGAGRSPVVPASRVGVAADPVGHGTFVSGILGAGWRNGRGIAPVAPGVQILPITTFSDDGLGSSESVVPAIVWAVDHGADVVNLSLGSIYSDPSMHEAVRYAESKGVVVVAAAGNFGRSIPVYPAAYPEVLAVAATDRLGQRASFSETGPWIDLAAPGDDVPSTTVDGGYGTWRGTSFAAPHVAAAAALVLAARPQATPAQVRALLVNNSRDAGPVGFDESYGWGVLDIAASVLAASRPSGAYRTVAATGAVESFGDRAAANSPPAVGTDVSPIGSGAVPSGLSVVVGAAARPGRSDGGIWTVQADGTVHALGSAPHLGDVPTAGLRLSAPIVGMAASPSGDGYWLVGADGGVLAFGDARFAGSLGDVRLAAPIVGMAAAPSSDGSGGGSGGGYWLVAADGGVFAFGAARFAGSLGDVRLAAPIVGMSAAPSSDGYWLVAADGGVFSFGDVGFFGSLGGRALNGRVIAITASPSGQGYWLLGRDGGVFTFGDAAYRGSSVERGGSGATGAAVVLIPD